MQRALTGAGIAGLVLGLGYLAEALRYPWGTTARPGPGLYPVLVGVLFTLGCLGVCLEGLRRRRDGGEVSWPRGSARSRVLATLAAALGYVLLLPYLGHPVAGTVAAVVELRTMGVTRWWLVVGVAVGMALSTNYLFGTMLDVPLPQGIWFQ